MFNFLPHEMIKGSELVCKDIAFVNNSWILIIEIDEKLNNNDLSVQVKCFGRAVCYVSPSKEFKILKRNLIDHDGLDIFIKCTLKEQEILDKENDKYEEAERLAEIRDLRDRLNSLE